MEVIPVEVFQILKDDAVKVPHSISPHIWKTQHTYVHYNFIHNNQDMEEIQVSMNE